MADSLEKAEMNACNSMSNESVAETSSSVVQNTQTNSSLSPVVRATISPTNCSVNAQQFSVEYLSQLVKDKKQLAAFPNIFVHMDRLIDEEISKVRVSLYRLESNDKESFVLPDPDGHVINLQEKIYIPVNAFPEYNFVGRILGPRGMTAKQLEQETGCKVMVRGKGSMRDRNKEEMSRGKPNWEHLSDDLHVLVQCEDTENRAKLKLKRAVDDIKRLLVPAAEGEDELKRKQLMELAIINGTYRPASQSKIALQTPRLLTPMTVSSSPMRSPNMGAPMILSPTRLAGGGSPSSFASVAPFLQGFNADFAAAASLLYNCSMDPLASWTAGAYPFNGGSAVSFAPPLMAAGDFHSMDSHVGRLMSSRR